MKSCLGRLPVLFVAALVMLSSLPATAAAVDMFLKLADDQGVILIPGESVDARHLNEIVVLSFSEGITVAYSSVAGGGQIGRASFPDIQVTKLLDKASPLLYSYAAQGRNISKAVLSVRKAGSSFDYYQITLKDVLITSVRTGQTGADLTETLTFNFKTIEWRYVPQKPDGSPDQAIITTWNLGAATP